ncbi:hypothetical protein R6Q59_022987 [Mikania micrantha]
MATLNETFLFTSRESDKFPCRARKSPRSRAVDSSRSFLNIGVGPINDSRPKKRPRPNNELEDWGIGSIAMGPTNNLDLNNTPDSTSIVPGSIDQGMANHLDEGDVGNGRGASVDSSGYSKEVNDETRNTIQVAEQVGIHISSHVREVFGSSEEMLDWVQNLAYSLGVVIVTKRSNKRPCGFVYKIVIANMMKMPEAGVLIANKFGAVVHL